MPRKRKDEEREKGNFSSSQLKEALLDYALTKKFRETAKKHNLHYATLARYIKKQNEQGPAVVLGPNYAVNKVFSSDHEKELKDYIIFASKIHFGLTKKQVKEFAFNLARANQLKYPPSWEKNQWAGEDWLKGFRLRWPEVSLRKPEATSLARATAFNKTTTAEFFNNLEVVFKKFNIQACQVFNLDETGITTVHNPPNVLASKGTKQVGQATSGERGILITACCIISATGNAIPPFLIFPRVNFKPHMLNGAPLGAAGAATKSGWINKALFLDVLKHFAAHVRPTPNSPAVLIFDNHDSHVQYEVVKFCRENSIHVVTIPPHTSARLQPLDVAVFKSLKNFYNSYCNDWMISHPGRLISLYDVAQIFGQAYLKSFTLGNITNGFKATGIWPFNTNIFNEEHFLASFVSDRPPPVADLVSSNTSLEQPQSSTSFSVVSPQDARPFPKAPERKMIKGGRKRGKTVILTSTPMKEALEEMIKAKHPVRRQLLQDGGVKKKTTFKVDSETEEESEEIEEESEDDGQDWGEKSETDLEESDTDMNLENLKVGQYVMVKEGRGKGHLDVYSVGELKNVECDEVKVLYLKVKKSGFVKTDESFFFKKSQIIKILPPPQTFGGTKRSSSFLKFNCDFSNYGIQLI